MEEQPVPRLQKFSEAIMALEEVKLFLDNHGCIEEDSLVSSAIDAVASAHMCSSKQTSLLDYFSSAPDS